MPFTTPAFRLWTWRSARRTWRMSSCNSPAPGPRTPPEPETSMTGTGKDLSGRPVAGMMRWLAFLVAALVLAGCARTTATGAPHVPGDPPRTAARPDWKGPPLMDQTSFQAPDSLKMPLRSWLPDGTPPEAVFLALHGFCDHSGAWDVFGPSLAARNIAV